MAETPKPRSPRAPKKATPPPPELKPLAEIDCPAGCTDGEVLTFSYVTGIHDHVTCERCLGAGVVEVQRG